MNTSTLLLVLNTSRSNGPWSDEVSGLFLTVCLFFVFSGEKFRAAKERMIEEEALTRLLVEKEIFTKEEFLGMVKVDSGAE